MSVFSLSRRELLSRLIAAGVGGTVLSTFPSSQQLRAQTDEEAQNLIQKVGWMGENIAEQSEPVKEWLRNSSIIKATKREFETAVHGEWANDWALMPDSGGEHLVTLTRFQTHV